jgi:hypothetical protein
VWTVLLVILVLKIVVSAIYYALVVLFKKEKSRVFQLPEIEKLSKEERVKLLYSLRTKEIDVQLEAVKEFMSFSLKTSGEIR